MQDFANIPDWLGSAAIGAIIAALGYVIKLFIDWIQARNEQKVARHARLTKLNSLLDAARATFNIQNEHAQRLLEMLEESNIKVVGEGYEQKLASAYNDMDKDQLQLHKLIRSMTVNAMRPTNLAISNWLDSDDYYLAQKKGQLAYLLTQLNAHLILWLAKYESWIPNQEHHALVYMADEQRHGVGFPSELDQAVKNLLDKRR